MCVAQPGSTECAQISLFNINKMRLFLYRLTDKSILATLPENLLQKIKAKMFILLFSI